MTPEQIEIARHLGGCRFLPGSFDKRFASTLSGIATTEPEKELTEKQAEWLMRLLYKYRKQMGRIYEKHKEHPHCSRADGKQPKAKKPKTPHSQPNDDHITQQLELFS